MMAWQPVPGSDGVWEYDDDPPAPPAENEGQYYLWTLQSNGIREVPGLTSNAIYVKVRLVGTNVETMGELNKDFWDQFA